MRVAFMLHVLAAVIWVGGMFFAYAFLYPASAKSPPPSASPSGPRP